MLLFSKWKRRNACSAPLEQMLGYLADNDWDVHSAVGIRNKPPSSLVQDSYAAAVIKYLVTSYVQR
jgi:hypothetical protein